jgi:hypothetical protein
LQNDLAGSVFPKELVINRALEAVFDKEADRFQVCDESRKERVLGLALFLRNYLARHRKREQLDAFCPGAFRSLLGPWENTGCS